MRTEHEIKNEIQALSNDAEMYRRRYLKYKDDIYLADGAKGSMLEDLNMITALEWVLGQHNRFN
jgi:hypothetical protein